MNIHEQILLQGSGMNPACPEYRELLEKIFKGDIGPSQFTGEQQKLIDAIIQK